MKKFLSLVLALVMTMSLVTIGAGAADYSDLTDKSEIQYEEAVAVLNKLGIITGYEDGSFKPTGALTRGAAAKIIVSLMIGSEAASNLTVAAAPYSDVPVTNTFAGVISYCKTAGYINGYADGTFRPTAPLTGYAFTKMLLGALGYDGKIEGFTGSGWTMNVARLGNVAGLFDNFKTAFKGNDGVTREAACLLALNTLKATEVEYTGGASVSAGDANVTINATRELKTSNNKNINQNIGKLKANSNGEYTLEFGEDHFADLKLVTEGGATDDFGRPSNKWSYKNITIGTYAVTPDYVFTARASGDTVTDKLKDMGLNDLTMGLTASGEKQPKSFSASKLFVNDDTSASISVNGIPALTGNGRLIEVYLDDDNADVIKAVVVVDTYIMQVKKVSSSSVTLKNPESNRVGATLNEIKSDDDCFNALKNLKVDDYVLVTVSGNDVKSVAIPQTVSGKLTAFTTGSHNLTGVNNVTIAGTKYNLALKADSADSKLSASTKLTSSNNTTAYLDTYGNVIYATDVESGADYFIYKEDYSSIVDGKVVLYAQGWDMDGNSVSLNLGTSGNGRGYLTSGGVYAYESTTDHDGEYKVTGGYIKDGTVKGTAPAKMITTSTSETIAKGDSYFNSTASYYDGSVKFLFIGWDGTDADTVTVKEGVQEVTNHSSSVLVGIQGDSNTRVKYVIVFDDYDVEASANVLYVKSADATTINAAGKTVSVFDAYVNGELQKGLVASKNNVTAGSFYTYTEKDGVYTLNSYTKTDKDTSVKEKETYALSHIVANILSNNAYLAEAFDDAPYTNDVTGVDLYCKKANVIDCSGDGWNISSLEDIKDVYNQMTAAQQATATIDLAFVYNGNPNSNNYGKVETIYVRDVTPAKQ